MASNCLQNSRQATTAHPEKFNEIKTLATGISGSGISRKIFPKRLCKTQVGMVSNNKKGSKCGKI